LLICPRRSTILFPTCAFVPRPTRRDALSQVTTDDAHHARTCRAGGRRRHDDGIKRSTLRRSAPPSERVTSTRRDSSLRGRLPRYRLLLVLQLLHACSIAFLRNDSGAPLRAVSLIAATDNSCLLCALGTQVPLHICLGWMATEWRARPCTSQTGSSVAIHRVIGRFGEFRSIEPSLLYDVSLS
jgi:hypothetical protein